MNRKGIFSGIAAVAAVLLIGAIFITATISAKNTSQENFSEKILESKKEWNNARYLLDKTLGDLLADSSVGCMWSAPGVPEIETYFANTINNSIKSCDFSDIAITSNAQENFLVSVKILCSKKISSDFEIKSFEKTAVFKKSVAFAMPGCTSIIVTDQDSLADEATWP